MSSDRALRQQLIQLLRGKQAHADVKSIISGVDPEYYVKRVRRLPYTLWGLLEHIRLSQRDILEYMEAPNYSAHEWPEDYWPAEKSPSIAMWEKSRRGLLHDLKKIEQIVTAKDLFSPVPAGKHIVLREILVLADHNAYHLGQMVVMRRLLGIW